MAIKHDIELRGTAYPAAYHAITELRISDRWSVIQRNEDEDKRPAKYGLQVFTEIWADEASRVRGDVPISRRVDRGSIDAGADAWEIGYAILDAALQGKYEQSERTKRMKMSGDIAHDFSIHKDEFRMLTLRGEPKKIVPADATTLLRAMPVAEDAGHVSVKFFFDELSTDLTAEEIHDLFSQLSGAPARGASLDAAVDEALAADEAKPDEQELFPPAVSQIDKDRAANAALLNKNTDPLPDQDKITDWEGATEAEVDIAPYVPDFTIIPDALAKFAMADESADEFRARLKGLWQRFGIEDGKHFPGGGEALTGEEKITMREIDIVLNSDEGKNASLLEWMLAGERRT